MWGKEVLDKEQLSVGDRQVQVQDGSWNGDHGGSELTVTSSLVQALHERSQSFLVENGALRVSLPQGRPRLLKTGHLKDKNN